MRFTSEDLMKAMGLKVGDRVKVKSLLKNVEDEIYTIDNTSGFCLLDKEGSLYNIFQLIETEFEILPRPKRVGDLECGTKGKDGQETCSNCPTRILCNSEECKELGTGDTLYTYLEAYKKNVFKYSDGRSDFDQEIYDLLKARLDKEVKSDETN